MQVEEMRAKATVCDVLAEQNQETVAVFFHEAARYWRELATQQEFLEQERVYRIIHSRPGD